MQSCAPTSSVEKDEQGGHNIIFVLSKASIYTELE